MTGSAGPPVADVVNGCVLQAWDFCDRFDAGGAAVTDR